MRISDWSSDVCSSDLSVDDLQERFPCAGRGVSAVEVAGHQMRRSRRPDVPLRGFDRGAMGHRVRTARMEGAAAGRSLRVRKRSEEHTSELQSLMRISYAVFCLKKKKNEIKAEQ